MREKEKNCEDELKKLSVELKHMKKLEEREQEIEMKIKEVELLPEIENLVLKQIEKDSVKQVSKKKPKEYFLVWLAMYNLYSS